jgi:hypothetical protein
MSCVSGNMSAKDRLNQSGTIHPRRMVISDTQGVMNHCRTLYRIKNDSSTPSVQRNGSRSVRPRRMGL